MNIKEAKIEIINTVKSYLKKDKNGAYRIPSIRQRPLLLIGPPGVGKTQIMEQVASECDIGLVAYTITHHTRQTAVGLPFIKEKTYDGKTYAISFTLNFEIVPVPIEWVEEQVYAVKSGKVYIDGLYYKGYKLGSKDYSYDKKIIVATNDNPLSLGHEEAGNEIIAMSGEFIKVSGKGNFTGTKYIAVSKVEESKKNIISVVFKPLARTYNATPQFIDIGKELVVKSNGKQISEWSYYKIDGDSHVEVAEGGEYDEKVQNFTVLYSREPIDAGSVKITIIK